MANIIEKELSMLRVCKTESERLEVVQKLKEKHKNDSLEDRMNNLKDIKDKVSELSLKVRLLQFQKHEMSFAYASN